MTAQASDSVIHRDMDFKLAHYTGTGLLNVFAALGYRPRGMCTACYAGYLAEYSIVDDRLFLSGLSVGPPDESGEFPKLFGVSGNPGGFLGVYYEGLREPMPFTGGLVLGNGFIQELYRHSGSHPAWKYERVYEVIFDSGRVIEDHDRSAAMAGYRTEYEHYWKTEWTPGNPPDFDLLADMFADRFSLDYRLRSRRRQPAAIPSASVHNNTC